MKFSVFESFWGDAYTVEANSRLLHPYQGRVHHHEAGFESVSGGDARSASRAACPYVTFEEVGLAGGERRSTARIIDVLVEKAGNVVPRRVRRCLPPLYPAYWGALANGYVPPQIVGSGAMLCHPRSLKGIERIILLF